MDALKTWDKIDRKSTFSSSMTEDSGDAGGTSSSHYPDEIPSMNSFKDGFNKGQTSRSQTGGIDQDVTSNSFSPVNRRETTFADVEKFLQVQTGDSENSQQVWGTLAKFVVNAIRKPQRRPGGKIYSLKDAVNYYIKVSRFQRSVGELIKAPDSNKCVQCSGMDLDVEKFLVKDRTASLKGTRLLDIPYKQKTGFGIFEVGSGSPRYLLGTLRAIWKKSVFCSFCRLVIQSAMQQPEGSWINIGDDPDSKKYGVSKASEMEASCYATWQIDGREKKETRLGGVSNSAQARTRRICLQWKGVEFHDSYLVLVAGPSLTNDFFLGRRVAPGGANVNLMKHWVDSCCDHHDKRCQIMPDKRFELMVKRSYFGVIDVKEMRLTRLPPVTSDGIPPCYVALSYTWGEQEPKFKTLLNNVRNSQKSLQPVWKSLPQTIQDAITLVQRMEERYLWVDSICIVQDSDKSWELNASSMDLVYGNAKFTICAADGYNSNAGLHGLSPAKRMFIQNIEEYAQGVRLMVSYPVEAYIERSAWNQRSWTFQERLLSKRCLIFTDSRVFFQCRSTTMREDIIPEEKRGWSVEHARAPLQILDYLTDKPILLYTNSVKMYTSRRLSRPENVLAAFQGIGNLIGKHLGSSILFGLPRSHFDWALLWEAVECPQRRTKGNFPTWSWCGWQDAIIEYKIHSTLLRTTPNLQKWLSQHTWIKWYVRDGYGSIKLVWDREQAGEEPSETLAGWGGYNKSVANESNPYGRAENTSPTTPLPIHEKHTPDEFSATIPEYPFGVHIGDVDDDPDVHFDDQKYLQFWTWSAFFRLSDHLASSKSAPPGKGLKRFGIMDYKRDWCGTIVLDEKRANEEFRPGQECEFIAISEAYGFSEEEYEGWMYYISKDRAQSEWDLYHVLLIEVDNEIAYRVGLGKIYKEAFENSCRQEKQWKEFILG